MQNADFIAVCCSVPVYHVIFHRNVVCLIKQICIVLGQELEKKTASCSISKCFRKLFRMCNNNVFI